MANEFYSASGIPIQGQVDDPAQMQNEFSAIESGFNKFPGLSGNAGKALVVNSTADAITTQTLVDTSTRAGYGKNKFINGNFDIWQRGDTQTSSGYDSADRWLNTHAGSTKTASKQSFTLGQTDVPGEPQFYYRTVVASTPGVGNFVLFEQRIESVRTFSGKQATLTFYAKADAAKNIAIEGRQSFGTGGSPSADITGISVNTLALTTAWQKFTITLTIPTTTGKTLGTNSNDYLAVGFWLDAGSNFNTRTNTLGQQSGTFDIAQVQIEEGDLSSPFEQKSIAVELANCQRYYWRGLPTTWFEGSSYAINGKLSWPVSFPAKMRAMPTLSNNGTPVFTNLGSMTWDSQTQDGAELRFIATAASINCSAHFASATDYLASDAEL